MHKKCPLSSETKEFNRQLRIGADDKNESQFSNKRSSYLRRRGTEHDVSLISARYILEELHKIDSICPHYVEIGKDQVRRDIDGKVCELRKSGELVYENTEGTNKKVYLHFAIPCIHGPPGETGDIQGVFELMGLPYLGAGPESSRLCFNKVSTKLWLDALDIPNTPFVFLYDQSEKGLLKARHFFQQEKNVFIKAASQGSSIGTYPVSTEEELEEKIKEAFQYSEYILIEKSVKGRELEMAVYEYENTLQVSLPGEIISPSGFYSYEEKYNKQSKTQTLVPAKDIPQDIIDQMKEWAIKTFNGLKIRHLARIDFFYTEENGELLLNEPNTFPGHTPISMFPMMLKNNQHQYHQFLSSIILKESRK